MENIFADRISDVPRSFIREILKVTVDESIISFAGGLPNRDLFPVDEITDAAVKVLKESGREVLQYSTSEGYLPLRQWISGRYKKRSGITIPVEQILITSGSQQGLDLLGKTLLNEGDHVIIEEPGYLGAIQAFSLYKAVFHAIPLNTDGIDTTRLADVLRSQKAKLFYAIPNFQNPAGITYSLPVREAAAALVENTGTVLVEDDPYGELRFMGSPQPSFRTMLPEDTVMLGSFSKIVVPSFRIGWITARDDIMEKLLIAKQASDLHTNYLGQRIIHRYLMDYDIDAHIAKIRDAYGRQRNAMIQAIRAHFPDEISFTEPEGGMFLWVTLPEGVSSMDLFNLAIKEKVAFVPGNPFYADNRETNTLRLNFSCVDESTAEEGIKRLAGVLKKYLKNTKA